MKKAVIILKLTVGLLVLFTLAACSSSKKIASPTVSLPIKNYSDINSMYFSCVDLKNSHLGVTNGTFSIGDYRSACYKDYCLVNFKTSAQPVEVWLKVADVNGMKKLPANYTPADFVVHTVDGAIISDGSRVEVTFHAEDMPSGATGNQQSCALLVDTIQPMNIGQSTPEPAFPLAGTWQGTARNGDFKFDITIKLESSCKVGDKCGTFDVPSMPCSGSFKLVNISNITYQFEAGDQVGSCTSGAKDYIEYLTGDNAIYTSKGEFGESSGILQKTAN